MASGVLGCFPSSLFKGYNFVYPSPVVGARRTVSWFLWLTLQTTGGSPTEPCIPGRKPALFTPTLFLTKTLILTELFSQHACWDARDNCLANAKICQCCVLTGQLDDKKKKVKGVYQALWKTSGSFKGNVVCAFHIYLLVISSTTQKVIYYYLNFTDKETRHRSLCL
jgi:hypothetical protein